MDEYRIFGPPGTGKTTSLATKYIPDAIEKFGPEKVMVVSFTRTAAMKIARQKSIKTGQRIALPPENVGTLHSICYHALAQPTIVETDKNLIQEWNSQNPRYTIYQYKTATLDLMGESASSNDGDQLLANVNNLRNRLATIFPMKERMFFKKWRQFKNLTNSVDFTDLIELCIDTIPYAPMQPDVIFVDEAQDMTKLQLKLIRNWALECKWIILVGDDDQCSIKGTRVLTTQGYKNIELLDPKIDKLASYSRSDARVYTGTHKNGGYSFKIEKRIANERIYRIHCDMKSTAVTYNHIWLTKWSDKAKEPNKTVVYLMAKKDYYRIGWCQLLRSDGCFHVAARTRLEDADKTWILNWYNSKSEASMWESFFAVEYGIPMLPFVEHPNRSYYDQKFLDTFWQKINKRKLHDRAFRLLQYCNKELKYPFWSKQMARTRRGGKTIMKVKTCNLLENLMLIPSHQAGKKVLWKNFTISSNWYSGSVYSLDVEKYKTYIADGLITHNCIFSFTGATPDAFLYPPVDDKKKTILRQSYRVPQEILTRANKLIKKVTHRESKEYLARQYNGQTVQGACKTIKSTWKEPDGIVTMALKYLDKDKSIMFLASCAYMLTNLKEQLKQNGVPFHNPYRVSRGDWNPLQSSGSGVSAREILLDFLSNGIDPNWWNINQFVTWAQFVKTGPTGLVHGRGRPGIAALKKAIEKNEPGLHTAENVAPQLLTPIALQHAKAHDVQWLYDNLKSQRQETFEYPKRIYNMYGKKKIEQTPKAIIGTIHSVKGEDADIVFLFPDISWQAHTQMEKSEENCEAVYRVFYVGMTRAREELIICTPATKKPSTNYEPLKSKRLKQPMLYVEI